MTDRKFNNFRTAITDPNYFFGRTDLIETILKSPFQARIVLGGRRIGKTSLLRAIEWTFLNPKFNSTSRAFPVFVNLQAEQPQSPDNLRYILIQLLREAIERWKNTKLSELRETYQYYLRQVLSAQVSLGPFLKLTITNPDQTKCLTHDDFQYILLKSLEELREDLHFDGVCFLFDEAEFIAKQTWSDDALSYLRGIKETNTSLQTFIGMIVSGYRGLKNYRQKVGSPFSNIADVKWLCSLTDSETRLLITGRAAEENVPLTEGEIQQIFKLSGFHPFLVQQLLNVVFDHYHNTGSLSIESLVEDALWQHELTFSNWWNADGTSDGFGDEERKVYLALMEKRRGTYKELAQITKLTTNKVRNALQVLEGTGVIKKLTLQHYELSSQLFERWVIQERT